MQITYYLNRGDILELTVRREVEEDDYITHFVDYPDEIESETREGNFTYHYHPVGTRFRVWENYEFPSKPRYGTAGGNVGIPLQVETNGQWDFEAYYTMLSPGEFQLVSKEQERSVSVNGVPE